MGQGQRRATRAAALVGAVLLAMLPAGVWAADAFTDVPDDNVHHGAITAVRDAGVTGGCAPSAYCPAEPVRRDQMASFLDRLGALSGQAPVVRAATAEQAATAEHATTADTATTATTADTAGTAETAADAGTLDGLTPGELAPLSVVPATFAIATNATSYEDLLDATTQIIVPEGRQALLLTRFSAESDCYGPDGWCSVRILVDGEEAQPAAGMDYAFDSPDLHSEDFGHWTGHAMERVTGPLSAGTYTVTVQYAVTDAGITFRLDDWLLVAEARFVS